MRIRVAGAFSHYNELLPFIIKNKLQNKISVYDGINSTWSGGRICRLYPTEFNLKQFETYQSLGISVFLTFSNHQINLNSTKELEILEILNTGKNNGIVLVNEELRSLCRSKFKNLRLIYSITGHSDNFEDFDTSLEQKYDLIVPRFENVFNPKFLAKADTSKYEILVNDTCVLGCRLWNRHFKAINNTNTCSKEQSIEELQKIQECWIPGFNPNAESKHECMDLTTEAIQRACSLGYRHFKISGRELKENYINEITKYTKRILGLPEIF